jgi:hypothetical protein
MLFMVIEHFKNRDPEPIYARFRAHGRMAPEGVTYHGSWIEPNFARCFQVMECDDAGKLMQWIARWRDLADFEVIPVVPSDVTAAIVTAAAKDGPPAR